MSSYLKGIHPAEFARWCPVMALWLSIIIRRKCFLICQHELLSMWKECVCFWRKVLGEENGEGGLPRRRRTLAASVRMQIPSLGASMASHGLPNPSIRLSWLLLISLLSRAAKVTCRLVRIRERHPFLPAAGGGCAPQWRQKNSTECSFHSLLGQASLFSEQHTQLCVVGLALPFWVSSPSRDAGAVDILDLGDAAPTLGEPWVCGPQLDTCFLSSYYPSLAPMESYLLLTFSLATVTINYAF